MCPIQLFKCLADDTRLRTLLLITDQQELCVCELTMALDVIQPKISRHLAQLRSSGLLNDRRQGQWIYYRINPDLPSWVTGLMQITLDANSTLVAEDLQRLERMGDRPTRIAQCC